MAYKSIGIMKKIFTLLLFIVFVLLVVVLVIKNQEQVLFSFPFIELEAQLGLLMLAAFIGGIGVGALFMSFSLLKSKMVGSKAKRQLAKVEKEVENLRAMPIKDEV